jgi:hypothetical protein
VNYCVSDKALSEEPTRSLLDIHTLRVEMKLLACL